MLGIFLTKMFWEIFVLDKASFINENEENICIDGGMSQ